MRAVLGQQPIALHLHICGQLREASAQMAPLIRKEAALAEEGSFVLLFSKGGDLAAGNTLSPPVGLPFDSRKRRGEMAQVAQKRRDLHIHALDNITKAGAPPDLVQGHVRGAFKVAQLGVDVSGRVHGSQNRKFCLPFHRKVCRRPGEQKTVPYGQEA